MRFFSINKNYDGNIVVEYGDYKHLDEALEALDTQTCVGVYTDYQMINIIKQVVRLVPKLKRLLML